MTSEIMKFAYFTKTQKSKYFENKTLFFSIKKINSFDVKGYFMARNN